MSNILDRPPKIYHKHLQQSFDWAIDNTINVKKTLVKSGNTVEEVIEAAYPKYELETLEYVGRKDDKGKDLIEGDEVCYGENKDCFGVIAWSNFWLTWVIQPRKLPESKMTQHILSEFLRDYQPDQIHFISHKHGEIEQ